MAFCRSECITSPKMHNISSGRWALSLHWVRGGREGKLEGGRRKLVTAVETRSPQLQEVNVGLG